MLERRLAGALSLALALLAAPAVAGASARPLAVRLLRPAAPVFGLRVPAPTDASEDADALALDDWIAARDGDVPAHLVVLVHGLDDPGWIFKDLVPALRAAGHEVVELQYPNDGPIAASAALLAGELDALRRLGVREVTLVAHSMGGLVSRDALTRPDAPPRPRVRRLITCGTPNHGSHLARLRGVGEVREHLSRILSGEGHWLGGTTDGGGEAGRDLRPGSDYLRELNARPLPAGVPITIIAARVTPLDAREGTILGAAIRGAARSKACPAWLAGPLGRAGDDVDTLARGTVRAVGDGLVTLDSARLEGVEDLVVVEANHASMLARILPGAAEPPALPVVLDRVARDADKSESPVADPGRASGGSLRPDPIGR